MFKTFNSRITYVLDVVTSVLILLFLNLRRIFWLNDLAMRAAGDLRFGGCREEASRL